MCNHNYNLDFLNLYMLDATYMQCVLRCDKCGKLAERHKWIEEHNNKVKVEQAMRAKEGKTLQ